MKHVRISVLAGTAAMMAIAASSASAASEMDNLRTDTKSAVDTVSKYRTSTQENMKYESEKTRAIVANTWENFEAVNGKLQGYLRTMTGSEVTEFKALQKDRKSAMESLQKDFANAMSGSDASAQTAARDAILAADSKYFEHVKAYVAADKMDAFIAFRDAFIKARTDNLSTRNASSNMKKGMKKGLETGKSEQTNAVITKFNANLDAILAPMLVGEQYKYLTALRARLTAMIEKANASGPQDTVAKNALRGALDVVNKKISSLPAVP